MEDNRVLERLLQLKQKYASQSKNNTVIPSSSSPPSSSSYLNAADSQNSAAPSVAETRRTRVRSTSLSSSKPSVIFDSSISSVGASKGPFRRRKVSHNQLSATRPASMMGASRASTAVNDNVVSDDSSAPAPSLLSPASLSHVSSDILSAEVSRRVQERLAREEAERVAAAAQSQLALQSATLQEQRRREQKLASLAEPLSFALESLKSKYDAAMDLMRAEQQQLRLLADRNEARVATEKSRAEEALARLALLDATNGTVLPGDGSEASSFLPGPVSSSAAGSEARRQMSQVSSQQWLELTRALEEEKKRRFDAEDQCDSLRSTISTLQCKIAEANVFARYAQAMPQAEEDDDEAAALEAQEDEETATDEEEASFRGERDDAIDSSDDSEIAVYSLETQVKRLQASLAQSRKQSHSSRLSAAKLRGEKVALRRALRQKQAQLREKEEAALKHSLESAPMMHQGAASAAIEQSSKESFNRLLGENESLRGELRIEQRRNGALSKSFNDLQRKFHADISSSSQRLGELGKQAQRSSELLAAAEKVSAEWRDEALDLRRQLSDTQQQCSQLESDCKVFQLKSDEYERRLSAISQRGMGLTGSDLEQVFAQSQRLSQQLAEQYRHAVAQSQRLRGQCQQLQDKLKAERSRLHSLELAEALSRAADGDSTALEKLKMEEHQRARERMVEKEAAAAAAKEEEAARAEVEEAEAEKIAPLEAVNQASSAAPSRRDQASHRVPDSSQRRNQRFSSGVVERNAHASSRSVAREPRQQHPAIVVNQLSRSEDGTFPRFATAGDRFAGNSPTSSRRPVEPPKHSAPLSFFEPVEGDHIDYLLSKALCEDQSLLDTLPDNFHRISPAAYAFGLRRVALCDRNSVLCVRIGGGFETFSHWAKKHGPNEQYRLKAASKKYQGLLFES